VIPLMHIHHLGIQHRGLKPEDIVYGRIKITNIELSQFCEATSLSSTPCGFLCYGSPERLSKQSSNCRTHDVWCYGVMMTMMVTAHLPWMRLNQSQLFQSIRDAEDTVPDSILPRASSSFVAF
jgi:serine/threonine protein kinase